MIPSLCSPGHLLCFELYLIERDDQEGHSVERAPPRAAPANHQPGNLRVLGHALGQA
jgi:hypothetical protein